MDMVMQHETFVFVQLILARSLSHFINTGNGNVVSDSLGITPLLDYLSLAKTLSQDA